MKWTNSLNEIIRMSRCMQCVCCALSLTEKCAECLHQIWSEPTKKQQQHTNNWEKRLNSNLTKWLNAKVAPIFALRLRITAFLTFFCRCIRCIEFIFVLPCFRFVTQCTQQQCLCCWCFFFFIHSFRLFIRRSSESWEPNRKENVYLLLYRKQHHTPFGWICIVDRMPHQNA